MVVYQLRFFFDYNCGGCLWANNEAAYEKFGVGPLDADYYDLNGNLLTPGVIVLPDVLKERVAALDGLFAQSLDWNDPGGPSLWSQEKWNDFYAESKLLCEQVAQYLGVDFEITYAQP